MNDAQIKVDYTYFDVGTGETRNDWADLDLSDYMDIEFLYELSRDKNVMLTNLELKNW